MSLVAVAEAQTKSGPQTESRGQEARKQAGALNHVGFWAAASTAVLTAWFIVAFGPWIAGQPAWHGIDAFAKAFQVVPYIAWVLPCLFLAMIFPVMLSTIHFVTAPKRRIWSWLGLMFGAFYGAVLGAVYWVILTVVPSSISSGDLQGLAPLVVTSPHSLANALEGIGYGFMGLATLFAGLAVESGGLKSWIRWLLVANGTAGLVGVVLGGIGIVVATMVALAAWAVTLPVAMVVLALFFRRRLRSDG